MARLGDICTVVSGSTPKTSSPEYWDGDIKWITPAELNEDSFYIFDSQRHITELGKEETGLSYMPAGTVILSSRAPIGKTAIAGCELCCNQGFKNLICSDAILNEYLYYFLKGKTDYLNSLGRGATFKEISKSIVENIEIKLPELEEQKKIAKRFGQIYRLISLRKQQLAKLDELVKARFVELFGDPNTNLMGWDTISFSDAFDIASSKRILKSEWKTTGIPFLRVRDMVQLATTGTMNNEFYVSEDFYSSLSDSDGVPSEGDILVSATSTLGKCHIVAHGERFYFKDADVLRFRPKVKIDPVYFVEVMKTAYIKEQIERTLGITTVSHFTIAAAKKIYLRVPEMDLQREFAVFVEQIDKSKSAIQQGLKKLETLKKALIQEYFG